MDCFLIWPWYGPLGASGYCGLGSKYPSLIFSWQGIHFEQNEQKSTTLRLPRIQYSDDEDDDYFNYRSTANIPFKKLKILSCSEDAELYALLTKLKDGVTVFALDIECLTTSIRVNNRPDTNSNKAVLVSLYGDARSFPRVQIDRAWIQLEQLSGEIIRLNGYIIKSNCITRQLYESVRRKGKTLAQMKISTLQLFLQLQGV